MCLPLARRESERANRMTPRCVIITPRAGGRYDDVALVRPLDERDVPARRDRDRDLLAVHRLPFVRGHREVFLTRMTRRGGGGGEADGEAARHTTRRERGGPRDDGGGDDNAFRATTVVTTTVTRGARSHGRDGTQDGRDDTSSTDLSFLQLS